MYWLYKETDIMIDLDADIDFSQSGLTSLGFLSFSLTYFEIIQLSLILSHNNLMAVDLFSRFHLDVFPYTVKGDRIPKIHTLDLSHNNLGNLSCKQDFPSCSPICVSSIFIITITRKFPIINMILEMEQTTS